MIFDVARQRNRLLFLLFLVLAFALLTLYRLLYLQVLGREELLEKAGGQTTNQQVRPAQRGMIRDARGVLLAGNKKVNSVYAIPKDVEDPLLAASALSPLLEIRTEDLLAKIEQAKNEQKISRIYLKRQVSPEVSEKVQNLKIKGIGLLPETKRVYPADTLASHLLGFVNIDGKGQYGVEGQYDKLLAGIPGQLSTEGGGDEVAEGLYQVSSPIKGADLVLTLDVNVQYIVERELKRVYELDRAKEASAIVMDPQTGAIIASASFPDYNPNDYQNVTDAALFVDPNIAAAYEPGSTFKVITLSSALDENVITPQTSIDCTGTFEYGGVTIHNAYGGKAHGEESMIQVLANSCNVGAATVSTRMGRDLYYKRLLSYGFGSTTGVDLQGEAPGLLRNPAEWYDSDLAMMAFGQSIGVTPIQMITAFSAVANGGKLMRPYVVAEVHDSSGVTVQGGEVVRQAISPETAATMRAMMVNAVDNGIANMASIPGYSVAGKTGTAQIPNPSGGGYIEGTYIHSFIGFTPAEDPKFILMVIIKNPDSETPAVNPMTLYKNIATELLEYYRVPPDRQEY